MSSNAPASLPLWDLSDLYGSPADPVLEQDLAGLLADAKAFAERYRGKLATQGGDTLGEAVAEYERMDEVMAKAMSYAQLLQAGDADDPEIGRFAQTMQERVTDISGHLLFFSLELNRIEDDVLEAKLKSPALARYRPWLRTQRLFRPHQLSDELEKLLLEKSVAGRGAWNRLFDETMAALRFPFGAKQLTVTEILDKLSDKDGANRRTAAKAIGTTLGANIRLFSLATNTLAKDKEVEDRWRGYPKPASARHLANQVEDAVVDALVAAVNAEIPNLSHRYYALKARWMGMDKLDYWDRNAPLPEDDDTEIPWDRAVRLVLDAYGAFSPELAAVGRRFFESAWIDAGPRPGKASGAFAHPTVPSAHPYLLLNYLGKARDVMTLAHELGHGVHQILAGDQGHFQSDTPLTLAETASVFGEMLTFRALVAAENDPHRRRVLIASKIEDMINTVVRQTAFYEFETLIHDERRAKGELTPDRIGEIWMSVQAASLGPVFRFDPEYRHYWSYIPHFVHSPFYVYAYAFGDCLVNSLYDVYRSGAPDFEGKYIEMLKAGGTLPHRELLAPFGLDAGDPGFWKRGLNVVIDLINDLEKSF